MSHQTVRLDRGRHRSPQDGACAMELASMLADEPFTDHPRSVCPAIAGFVRAYNDALDDRRRQDLYAYAAKAVGTRSSTAVGRRRAERVEEWGAARRSERPLLLRWLVSRSPLWPFKGSAESRTTAVARGLGSIGDEAHAEVLALLDELVAMRGAPSAPLERAGDTKASPADGELAHLLGQKAEPEESEHR